MTWSNSKGAAGILYAGVAAGREPPSLVHTRGAGGGFSGVITGAGCGRWGESGGIVGAVVVEDAVAVEVGGELGRWLGVINQLAGAGREPPTPANPRDRADAAGPRRGGACLGVVRWYDSADGLGIGVTVARLTLDQLVKVQILDPQLFGGARALWRGVPSRDWTGRLASPGEPAGTFMDVEVDPTTRGGQGGLLRDPAAEVVAFLKGRSVPCPRCAYDLRDIRTAKCPECGEPLVLKIGSPRARFGWMVLAMAPGCFSGVAALFVMIPIYMTMGRSFPPGQGLPWPVVVADAFGFFSAATVGLMYRHRHGIMAWTARRQGAFAGAVWVIHVLMLVLLLLAMWHWK
jgi:hypothetical protein